MGRAQLHFKVGRWQDGDDPRDIMIYADAITSVRTYLDGKQDQILVQMAGYECLVMADYLEVCAHLEALARNFEGSYFVAETPKHFKPPGAK